MASVNFDFFIQENDQQIPYSEQVNRFTENILVQVSNPLGLAGTVSSPIFYMQGFQR